jgi:uncharacterized protein (DUF2141 family)
LAFLALAAFAAPAGAECSLTVKVEKVSPRGGDLRIALYTETTWTNDNAEPAARIVVPARASETVAVLHNVKPGVYRLKMFQDVNRNGEFDMDWLGLPLEKYGFSNDAHPIFSEPDFSRVKFRIVDGENTITIHLQ